MEYKKLILPAALFASFIVLLVIFFGSQGKEKTPEISPLEKVGEELSGQQIQEIDTKKIVLFFVSEKDSVLHKEEREIVVGSNLENQIETTLEQLIEGSKEGLLSPFPPETSIRGVYIAGNEIVYLDFSAELQTGHPSGSSAEISTIFAVVNSVAFNFKSIKKVFILINGAEQETLAGHIDLRRPFLPRFDLVSD